MPAIAPNMPPNARPRQGRRRPAPRFCAACAGGVTTAKACVSAAVKLRLTTRTRRRFIAARANLPLCRYSWYYLLCPAARLPSCSSPAATASRRRGQRPGHHDQVPATHNERRRGQRAGHHDQVPAKSNERRSRATAWAQLLSTCDAQGAAPRAAAWAPRTSPCDAQRAAPRTTPWAPRPSTCAAPRATARATRTSMCDAQQAVPRAKA
jgi:hypothetical protein